MRDMNVLSVYQIRTYQILWFMYKVKHNLNPRVFANTFKGIHYKYPTRYSKNNFEKPKATNKTTSFSIFSRGPHTAGSR